jgi:hypothetical protein
LRVTNLIKTKLAGTLVVALCVTVAAPSLAGAQEIDPTTSQYADELTQIETGTDVCLDNGSGSGTGTAGGGSGSLDECVEAPPTNVTASGGPGDPGSPSGLGGRVGPLPFTGFDVIAMAAVALAVAGLGLALQRAVSRQPSGPA